MMARSAPRPRKGKVIGAIIGIVMLLIFGLPAAKGIRDVDVSWSGGRYTTKLEEFIEIADGVNVATLFEQLFMQGPNPPN